MTIKEYDNLKVGDRVLAYIYDDKLENYRWVDTAVSHIWETVSGEGFTSGCKTCVMVYNDKTCCNQSYVGYDEVKNV